MVDNNRRTKLLPKIVFGQALFGLAICVIAFTTIFYAEGYRFDVRTLKISRTGVLLLEYLPKEANISINDKNICTSNPCVKNLPSGQYDIEISESGFQDWVLHLNLQSESVNVYKDIVLFRDTIVSTELTDSSKIAILNSPTDVLASNTADRMYYNSHEIWIGDKLLTRLSGNINRAVWYPDMAHIVFQIDDEIRVIETNGKNDILLVKLSQNKLTNFGIGSRGEELYYADNDKNMIAVIR